MPALYYSPGSSYGGICAPPFDKFNNLVAITFPPMGEQLIPTLYAVLGALDVDPVARVEIIERAGTPNADFNGYSWLILDGPFPILPHFEWMGSTGLFVQGGKQALDAFVKKVREK